MSHDQLAKDMRSSFEASLPLRLGRSSRVKLQNIIPSHWFSAAASECHGMFIAGHFYGTISVAQAYVESLSKYLCEAYGVRGNQNDAAKRWRKLLAEKHAFVPRPHRARSRTASARPVAGPWLPGTQEERASNPRLVQDCHPGRSEAESREPGAFSAGMLILAPCVPDGRARPPRCQ